MARRPFSDGSCGDEQLVRQLPALLRQHRPDLMEGKKLYRSPPGFTGWSGHWAKAQQPEHTDFRPTHRDWDADGVRGTAARMEQFCVHVLLVQLYAKHLVATTRPLARPLTAGGVRQNCYLSCTNRSIPAVLHSSSAAPTGMSWICLRPSLISNSSPGFRPSWAV